MSRRFQPHFADPKSVIIHARDGNALLAAGITVPTDATAGYATGCIFLHTDGAAGTEFYVNQGTASSCDFNVLTGVNLSGLTASATELNTLDNQTLTTGAGVGITAGTGTVYKNSVQLSGGIYYTTIMIDLTGLASSTTDLDIIGVAGGPAHLGQITAAQNGTILFGRMTCFELPLTGADDIDLYAATEGTGVFDGGIAALTETALITAGAAWTATTATTGVKPFTAVPAANQYLYLTGGEAGTAATYTAGQFLIELFGY